MEEMLFFDAEIVEDDPDAPVGTLIKLGDNVKKEEPAPAAAEEPVNEVAEETAEQVPEEEPVEEAAEAEEAAPEEEPASEEIAEEEIAEEEPAPAEEVAEDEPAADDTPEENIEEVPVAEEAPAEEPVVDEEIAQIIKAMAAEVAAEEAAYAAANAPVVEETPVAEEVPAEEPVAEEEPAPAEEVAEEAPAPVEEAAEAPAPANEEETEDESEEDEDVPAAFPNMRYNKSFTARLTLAPNEIKQYYNELKNALLSYKKVSSRISWACDSINNGRKKLAVLNVKGKSLYLYLALDAADYADTKYSVVNVETKKYEATPCLYKIKSDRKEKWALELIKDLAEKAELAEGKESAENFIPEKASVEELIDKGLIKLVAINEKASDDEAEAPATAPAPAPVEKPAEETHNIKTSKMSLKSGEGLQTELNDTKFEVEKKNSVKVVKPKKESSPDDIWAVAVINPAKKAEPVKKEEKPSPVKEETKKAPAKKVVKEEKPVKAAPAKKAEPVKKADDDKKVVGKFIIEQNEDIFFFSLYANNGQLLYESREYASKASCKSGIETFKKNIETCDYRIAQDKNKNWRYIFRKGNSIYIGESYKSEQSATNSAESTKRFALISDIVE